VQRQLPAPPTVGVARRAGQVTATMSKVRTPISSVLIVVLRALVVSTFQVRAVSPIELRYCSRPEIWF
jgi:hypothetical protein